MFALALLGVCVCGAVDKDAFHWAGLLKKGVNISCALEAPEEGKWGVVIEEEHIDAIKKAGFSSVRLPVRWNTHALEDAPYTVDPAFLKRVDQILRWCLERGLVVVLDWHHYMEFQAKPKEHKDRFLGIWGQLSAHYKDWPPTLYFEILNEPAEALTIEQWNRYQNQALQVIREMNPNRAVVVTSIQHSNASQLQHLVLPRNDRNLIPTFHMYFPYRFTHQGVPKPGKPPVPLGAKWGIKRDVAKLTELMDQAAAYGRKTRRPVWLGEFGTFHLAPSAERVEWTTFVRAEAEKRGFPWAYWSFCSAKFGIYDQKTKQWNEALTQVLFPGPDTVKPNVLFIICDDLNDWALHPAGHPVAKTPHMDRLRDRSVSFSNAHVVVPVCGPSRKCLFSGLYPQTINDYGFAAWKDTKGLQGCVPLPLHFRNNGYSTYGTGKLLHRGAEGDFYTAYGIGSDYGPWPWQGKGRPMNTPHPAQFGTWKAHLPIPMHRDLNYGPLSNVPVWKAGAVKGIPGAKGWYNESGKSFKYIDAENRDRTPDEISADWAIDVIRKKHDCSFYLGVGFIRPHTPLYAPKKYFDMYPVEEITLPPYKQDDLADCASILRKRWQWGYKKYEALVAAGGEKAWKEWVQAYMACTTFVDDQVGRVLDALETSPHRSNTVIVLTSDHGYHVGEKDCIQKWHLWDESSRVPLFVHVPNGQGNGQTCDRPVSLIDVYPTLVDLCGLPAEPNQGRGGKPLDGHSLLPLLKDPSRGEWNGPPVAFMGIRDGKFSGAPGDTYTPHFSVRSCRYRYTLCGNGEEELYDHEKDPN